MKQRTIEDELRALRRASDITQLELALFLGHETSNYISLYEKGRRNVSKEFAMKVMKAIKQIRRFKKMEA
jgi:transcriptional regulator with XRE-family HTH domain